ncbi:MAG: hypothetical protein LBC75_07845 [Fibromonadaceae bacterium]|jgi:hypothetical protein|nr:hypothetical protein [Fibromonadaceae bacterium]
MKFRIAFSFSKTERKFRLRFWKWDIWNLDSVQEYENVKNDLSKAGFLSFGNSEEKDYDDGKLLFQALFEPGVESRIWKASKRFTSRAINIFSVNFENLEVRGTLGDPFYDSIALGMSNGCYFPDWENENGNWSTKGEIILNTKFFPSIYFAFSVIYETIVFLFLLWRGTKLAKKHPNGENLGTIRKWIFLKTREAL